MFGTPVNVAPEARAVEIDYKQIEATLNPSGGVLLVIGSWGSLSGELSLASSPCSPTRPLPLGRHVSQASGPGANFLIAP